jgi:hypothetical protein
VKDPVKAPEGFTPPEPKPLTVTNNDILPDMLKASLGVALRIATGIFAFGWRPKASLQDAPDNKYSLKIGPIYLSDISKARPPIPPSHCCARRHAFTAESREPPCRCPSLSARRSPSSSTSAIPARPACPAFPEPGGVGRVDWYGRGMRRGNGGRGGGRALATPLPRAPPAPHLLPLPPVRSGHVSSIPPY